MNKSVSVVIPVFNRPRLITRALESVFAQSFRPLTLIVVDNASTDNTPQVVADWIDSHNDDNFHAVLLHEPAKGACAARNRGLSRVTSDYVLFFDSDDEMHRDLVESAVEALESIPSPLRLVFWKSRLISPSGISVPHFATNRHLRNHIIHATLQTTQFAASTQLLRQAGGWNQSLPVWNDWELGIRLLLQRPGIKAIPRILTDRHFTAESITGTSFSAKAGLWERSIAAATEAMLSSNINPDSKNRSDSQIQIDKMKPEIPSLQRINLLLDYKKAILAAHYTREAKQSGQYSQSTVSTQSNPAIQLITDTLNRYPKHSIQRLILTFAYKYTAAGHRGAATILSPFL